MPLLGAPLKDAELEHRLTRIESSQRAIFWAISVGGAAMAWSNMRLGNRVGVQNGRVTKLEQREDSHEKEVADKRAWPRLDALERDVGDLKALSAVAIDVAAMKPVVAKVERYMLFTSWLFGGLTAVAGGVGVIVAFVL